MQSVISTVQTLVQLGSLIGASIKETLTPAARKAKEVIDLIKQNISGWAQLISSILNELAPIGKFMAPLKVNTF